MNSKKYYLKNLDELSIPKAGEVGWYGINYDCLDSIRQISPYIDVDMTSIESMHESMLSKVKPSEYVDQLSETLADHLKNKLLLILPGIYFTVGNMMMSKDFLNFNNEVVEIFSTLKDNPEFVKFRIDNNYPESSLALSANHKPLTRKDYRWLQNITYNHLGFREELYGTLETLQKPPAPQPKPSDPMWRTVETFQKAFYLSENAPKKITRLYSSINSYSRSWLSADL